MDAERGDPLLSSSRPEADPMVTIRVSAVRDAALSVAAVGVLARMLARPGEPIHLRDLGRVDEHRMLARALEELLDRGYVQVDAAGVHHVTDQPIDPGPVLVAGPQATGTARPRLEAVPEGDTVADWSTGPKRRARPPEELSLVEQAQVNREGRDRVKAELRASRTPTHTPHKSRTLRDLLEARRTTPEPHQRSGREEAGEEADESAAEGPQRPS